LQLRWSQPCSLSKLQSSTSCPYPLAKRDADKHKETNTIAADQGCEMNRTMATALLKTLIELCAASPAS
jgi:hypothetical protein